MLREMFVDIGFMKTLTKDILNLFNSDERKSEIEIDLQLWGQNKNVPAATNYQNKF